MKRLYVVIAILFLSVVLTGTQKGAWDTCIDSETIANWGYVHEDSNNVFTGVNTFEDTLKAKTGRCVTLTVAAYNSSPLAKFQADYVCDGTGDQVEIQQAITALPDSGGKVCLTEGIFTISAQIELKSNMILIGSGKSSYIIGVLGGGFNYGIYINAKKNVIVRELRIDGHETVIGFGLQITDSENCKVINCYIGDTGTDGIVITNSKDILIMGNYVYNCFRGLFGNSSSAYEVEDGSERVTIRDNIAYNCHKAFLPHTHIGCDICKEIKFLNNSCLGGDDGDCNIHVQSVADPLENINVMGNYLDVGYIGVENAIDGIISDNILLYASVIGGAAIGLDAASTGYIIDNNRIYGSINYGISSPAVNTIISNNIVEKCLNHGIKVTNEGSIITGNIVKNCGSTVTYISGIQIQGSYITVVDNHSFDDQGIRTQNYGIFLTPNCNYVTITGNVFRDVKGTPMYIPPDGNLQGRIWDSYSDHFQDCIVSAVAHIHIAITGTGAEQEIITAITNPDVPRNSSITSTNIGPPSGDVTIEGIDTKGNSVSDTLTINAGGITYGDVAFSTVSKIIIPATVPGTDNVEIGISDKLGMNNVIYVTGDVYKVKVNNADKTGEFNMVVDVDIDYGTIDMSSLVAGAIGAGDDITIWYRSNLNIID